MNGLRMFQGKGLSRTSAARFRKTIYEYYREDGRPLPWREDRTPYRVLVSEIMLQQTQVKRVLSKFNEFLGRFPELISLAEASLPQILEAWQGLGYNRRAMALHRIARIVVGELHGNIPNSKDKLQRLPGIGPATACAIEAFAFNKPAIFIETNIRRVFIHFFFKGVEGVRDREILPLVERTLDRDDPRNWYYALMDYGAMLRKAGVNPNRRSAHYKRQTPFQDSDRQIRSLILRTVLKETGLDRDNLVTILGRDSKRTNRLVDQLLIEGFLELRGDFMYISSDMGKTLV
jgi:A/G-specific adenine glycosylase